MLYTDESLCNKSDVEEEEYIDHMLNRAREGYIGYSYKINDEAFSKYIKRTNRWSVIFSFLIAVIAIIGFFIYGENSYEMKNPQALLIGLGIGSMFIGIAIIQIIGRKKSITWDGTVVDKTVEEKKRKRNTSDNDYYWEDFIIYTVLIQKDNVDNTIYKISGENDDTVYNYYQIGDRVRHHGGLNSFEKYDKSKDTIIFCNACASLNDIHDDYCHRCHCPLLK